GVARSGEYDAEPLGTLRVDGRISAQGGSLREEDRPGPDPALQEQAREHQAVAAVVPLAAEDPDRTRGKVGHPRDERPQETAARALHQRETRNARGDGAPVHLLHLRSSDDLHRLTLS